MPERFRVDKPGDVLAHGMVDGLYVCDSLRLDIEHRSGHGTGSMIASGLFGQLVERAFAEKYDVPAGFYVRVWFPLAMKADLLLRSRQVPPADNDVLVTPLDQCFEIEAGCDSIARNCLAGSLEQMLLALAPDYIVTMRDDQVYFGPLSAGATASIDVIEMVAEAVMAFDPNALADENARPYLGEDADFCFFCGFGVRLGATDCPSCGSGLEDDLD